MNVIYFLTFREIAGRAGHGYGISRFICTSQMSYLEQFSPTKKAQSVLENDARCREWNTEMFSPNLQDTQCTLLSSYCQNWIKPQSLVNDIFYRREDGLGLR